MKNEKIMLRLLPKILIELSELPVHDIIAIFNKYNVPFKDSQSIRENRFRIACKIAKEHAEIFLEESA